MDFIKGYFRALLASHRLNNVFQTYRVLQDVQVEEMRYAHQQLRSKPAYSIAFLIPGLPRYSGGHTSILRFGTCLENYGNRVSYVTIDDSPSASMAGNAALNLPHYKGSVVDRTYLEAEFDIGIATSWLTAYNLYGRANFGYKCYFVQDFEPFFYDHGDLFFLALKAYRFGFHMISLGQWNAAQIAVHAGKDVRIDVIDFPLDTQSYGITGRRIQIDGRVRIAVYVKLMGRRAPILLFESLDLLARRLRAKGIEPEIMIFGLDERIRVPVGKNLGRLGHDQLIALYERCDLGVVASLTNISLVPYEMIACGLPVVDFAEGSGPSFLDGDSVIFSACLPSDFVSRIIHYIDHQDELNEILRNAQRAIKGKTWDHSTAQYLDILRQTADRSP